MGEKEDAMNVMAATGKNLSQYKGGLVKIDRTEEALHFLRLARNTMATLVQEMEPQLYVDVANYIGESLENIATAMDTTLALRSAITREKEASV